jgi:hypothetical protein
MSGGWSEVHKPLTISAEMQTAPAPSEVKQHLEEQSAYLIGYLRPRKDSL